ncbi:hypothetical protein AB0M68_03790 [Streptomyces sp. NPDC051453]|uniref:hypothetical protein n=1 Tax=Streptomyces sp. NPDC051453 TaxID=3154941 RepID=UPI003420010F
MTARRIAGWALLSLIPAVFITLAVLSGQLAEFAIGTAIAVVLAAATIAGIRLLTDD